MRLCAALLLVYLLFQTPAKASVLFECEVEAQVGDALYLIPPGGLGDLANIAIAIKQQCANFSWWGYSVDANFDTPAGPIQFTQNLSAPDFVSGFWSYAMNDFQLGPSDLVPSIAPCSAEPLQTLAGQRGRARLYAFNFAAIRIAEKSSCGLHSADLIEIQSPVAFEMEFPVTISGFVVAAESFGDPKATEAKGTLSVTAKVGETEIPVGTFSSKSVTVVPDLQNFRKTVFVPVEVQAGSQFIDVQVKGSFTGEAIAVSSGYKGLLSGASTVGADVDLLVGNFSSVPPGVLITSSTDNAVLVDTRTGPGTVCGAEAEADLFPRLPVCGDQDDSGPPLELNCDGFRELPEVEVFEVPGSGPVDVTFDFVFRQALLDNGLSYFPVDDLAGRIGSLEPGDEEYLAAAMERAVEIFPRDSFASAPDVTFEFQGGDTLVFFIENERGQWFSLNALNSNGSDRFVGFESCDGTVTEFGFEDLFDADFDDVVFVVDPALISSGDCNGNRIADSYEIEQGLAGDCDANGRLDVCESDRDGDGTPDACDPMPDDVFDDIDQDGLAGDADNCPLHANESQTDQDEDGIGDACDVCVTSAINNDDDFDGVCELTDNCPGVPNPGQEDSNEDGVGDACEIFDDGFEDTQ